MLIHHIDKDNKETPSRSPIHYELIGAGGYGTYPDKMEFCCGGQVDGVDDVFVDVTGVGAAKYPLPEASGLQMSVVSTSAEDAAAGTGARTMRIQYLDADLVPQQEDVTLTGLTAKDMIATNIRRLQGIFSLTAGSVGAAAGDITLVDTATKAVVYAKISAGMNNSCAGVFTVPAGMMGRITDWTVAAGTATGTHFTRFFMQITQRGNLLLPVFIAHAQASVQNSFAHIDFAIPIPVVAGADVKVIACSDTSNAGVSCDTVFRGWIEPA